MCILFLGPNKESQNRIVNYLVELGEIVIRYEKKLDCDRFHMRDFDFLISYGYRYIIKKKVLEFFDKKLFTKRSDNGRIVKSDPSNIFK